MVLAGLLFLLLQSQPVSAKAETPKRCDTSPLILSVKSPAPSVTGVSMARAPAVVASLTSKPPLVRPLVETLMLMAVSVTLPTVRLSASA